MVFSVIIILVAGIIAYFHYVQGLFSAALSAICAVLAAVVAVSYQEVVVEALLKGKFADYANGIITIVLFAIVYVILRLLFDKLIPGNVSVPLLVDKIGAGAMGIVAGLFTAGIVAIAAQMLPFGPSIGGYSRMDVTSRDVTANLPGITQAQTLQAVDELKADKLDPAKATGLMLPADDLVIALVGKLSDDGSLAGDRALKSVHPSYLDELFAQRLGIQVGAKHTAMNLGGSNQIEVQGIYQLSAFQQVDAEPQQIRGQDRKLPASVKEDPSAVLLVIRLNVNRDATDSDNRFRFSPASARLVINGKDFYPEGTIETAGGSPRLYVSKPDDFLVMGPDAQGVDLAFRMDRSVILTDPDPKAKETKIKKGAFLEMKRLARVDLGGKEVQGAPPTNDKYTVMRKAGLEPAKLSATQPPPGSGNRPGSAAPAPPAQSSPLTFESAEVSSKLFTPINTGSYEGDPANITLATDGNAVIRQKKFAKLEIHPTQSITMLGKGDFLVSDLYVPSGKRMIQVKASPASGGDGWEWGDNLGAFELVDSTGVKYKPQGAWAKVKQGTSDKLVAKYDADSGATAINKEEGRPLDVWIAFLVPAGKQITDFQFKGGSAGSVNLQVP